MPYVYNHTFQDDKGNVRNIVVCPKDGGDPTQEEIDAAVSRDIKRSERENIAIWIILLSPIILGILKLIY